MGRSPGIRMLFLLSIYKIPAQLFFPLISGRIIVSWKQATLVTKAILNNLGLIVTHLTIRTLLRCYISQLIVLLKAVYYNSEAERSNISLEKDAHYASLHSHLSSWAFTASTKKLDLKL